jgi:hypothetical protein
MAIVVGPGTVKMNDLELTGGCLCGALRYSLSETPGDAGYCHCRMCQRASGAPVMAFGTVPLTALTWKAGTPSRYRSSDLAERWFCARCGTSIAIHADYQPDTVDIALATLDDPDAVPPGFHIWTASRVGWFDTADRHPRFAGFRPETLGGPPQQGAVAMAADRPA